MAQVYRASWDINLILGTNFTQKFSHLLFIVYCIFLHKSFLEYGRIEKIIICGGGGEKAISTSTHTWLKCFPEIENGIYHELVTSQ